MRVSLHLPTVAHRASQALVPPSEEKAQKDVFIIPGESFGHRLTAGVKSFTGELFSRGLPLAGALLGGFPGLIAGSVAVGAGNLLGGASGGRAMGETLKAGALGFLTSSATVMAAAAYGVGIGLTVGAGLVGLGAVLAGAREMSRQYLFSDVTIEPETFAEHYLEKADPYLQQAGLNLPEMTFKNDHEAHQAVAMAASAVSAAAPGPVALLLASEVAKELANPADVERIDGVLTRIFPRAEPSEMEGDIEIRKSDTLGLSPAVATSRTVILDEEFEEQSKPELLDFVKGHELSHVRHQDVIGLLGQNAVLDSLEQAARTTGPDGAVLFGLVHEKARLDKAALSRTNELRADAEGLEFAISKGHDGEDVVSEVSQSFSRGVPQHPWSSHPSDQVRIDALFDALSQS